MSQRVRLAIVLHHSKYWVRNDARRLYVGYHDGVGDHGHHEWVVQGYDLMTGKPSASLQLHDFPGTDLRQTVVFEIYGDYLYALSNQSSFEVEEIDWTSYYHCYRFPVLDPVVPRLQCQRIWRRQHRDGPINDSWTELGLHQDERTGTLHITECRREWKDGLSAQKRTYYSEPLIFAEQDLDADPTGTSAIPQRSESPSPPCSASATATQYPFNDPLYKAVTEENKPSYSEPKPRIPRNYHPEYSTTEAPRETTFLLAKTKYRTSIPSSDAFLDLVLDNYPSPGIRSPIPPRCWQQQIRLRIGSRAQAPPDDHTTGLLYPRTVDADGVPIPGSEERFRDRGITLWPPADAPVELLDLLNPEIVPGSASRLLGDVTAVTDERSLIYMAAPLFRQGGSRNIVLVNFDRWIRFPDLPRIVCEIDPEEPGRHVVMKRDVEARSGKGKKRERSDDDAEMGREEGKRWKTDDDRREWWSLERARHLDIGRGFQFEYKEKAKPRVSS